ncbi:hypothetical protein J21TS7_59090 [Paenibacillus cineris]|uniref:Uncharacterized protein n=1 Tax=Paenibacillus cineris TaxID=237530 RepID=A0ABQ4LM45_9BACL|nr:hypothetical protein J21TS7_59090 [Paenibacillus cineris]
MNAMSVQMMWFIYYYYRNHNIDLSYTAFYNEGINNTILFCEVYDNVLIHRSCKNPGQRISQTGCRAASGSWG